MLLGEFHTQVSDEINQDDRLDSLIAGATRRAARYIERNYTLLYMERFVEITVDVSADNARFVPWPSTLIKKLNFIRYQSGTVAANDASYVYLLPIQAQNAPVIESTDPSGYWLTGTDDLDVGGYLVLDNVGDTDLTLQAHYARLSDWPTALTDRHWLLENAEEVLLAQTMIFLAPSANEPDWLPAYKPMLDMGMKSLIDADTDMRSSGDFSGYKMVFK